MVVPEAAVTAVVPPPVWLSVKVDISRMPVVIVSVELVATLARVAVPLGFIDNKAS